MYSKFWMFCLMVVLMGCSGYRQETKRYQMPSNEGRFVYVEKNNTGNAQEMFDKVFLWVRQHMNTETTSIEDKSRENGFLKINALAPVTGRFDEEYCRYEWTITITDIAGTSYFKTLRMTDQFYPSISNIKQLNKYYGQMQQLLKKNLLNIDKK